MQDLCSAQLVTAGNLYTAFLSFRFGQFPGQTRTCGFPDGPFQFSGAGKKTIRGADQGICAAEVTKVDFPADEIDFHGIISPLRSDW